MNNITGAREAGYFMTTHAQMNSWECNRAMRLFLMSKHSAAYCSGLAIISKHKILAQHFFKFHKDIRGCAWSMLWDGEYIARKGVGFVRISPKDNINIDLYVTHTSSNHNGQNIRC